MRTLLLVLLATAALAVTATSASAARSIAEIRGKSQQRCENLYRYYAGGASVTERRNACRAVWRDFDRQLLDRQIRAWYSDIHQKREPIRYDDIWKLAMVKHRP